MELFPLPTPDSADPLKLQDFGREVRGINPCFATVEEFGQIEKALYEVCSHVSP